jgi:hypothetical protein
MTRLPVPYNKMTREERNAYHREWRRLNPASAKGATSRYRAKPAAKKLRRKRDAAARRRDPERFRAKDRAFAAKRPEWIRNKNYRALYGITLKQWEALFKRQRRRCAICRTAKPDARRWATDHDHRTGKVRGILCHRCNLALGWLGDSLAPVRRSTARILSYLEAA